MRVRSWLRVTGGPSEHSSAGPIASLEPDADRAVLVLTATLFVVLAQVSRTMFPLMYLMGEDWSFVLVGAISAAVYATPVLALPILRLGARHRLVAGASALAAASLAVQLVHPIPIWLAMAATGLALIGATLAVVALRHRPRALALGVMTGLALDTALRAPFRSWDLAWQDGPAAVVLTMSVVVGLVALTAAADRLPRPHPSTAGCAPFCLGPFLMLQLLFLQNLGYVASQARVSFAAATLVVLGADAAGLAALGAALGRPIPRLAIAPVAIVAAAATWFLTVATGRSVILLIVTLQVLATAALGAALPARDPGARTTALGVAGASMSFLVLVLLWQLDIDTPLPFPREILPGVAVLTLGALALRRSAAEVSLTARPDRRGVLVGIGTVAAVALSLSAWLWVDGPSTDPAGLRDDRVRVVQYNIRGALNPDGQIRPDDVALAIASSNPDVVILQEVARGWPIFGAGDVLARLQQRLGMPYRFEVAADGQFGNAILSRLPMTLVSSGLLPEVPGKQDRIYLAVRLDLGTAGTAGTAGTLLVVGAHLESDDVGQIEALIEAWGGEEPAIVAGDLNMQPSDVANVARFTSAGLVDAEGATGDPCRTTSAEPTTPCDRVSWVFATPDLEILGFRIGTVAASDHLPVHAVLGLPTG